MRQPRVRTRAAIGGILAVLVCACASGSAVSPSASLDDPTEKLAQVLARGTLVLWTDPNYAPQSFAVENASRLAETRCAPNQMTAPEMSGYDAEIGKLVAADMGVEPCFVSTPFDSMIAGSWGDRYDVAWGSGALTVDRMERLYVTQPYYSTSANFFVHADSGIVTPAQLSGRKIGACAGCTHELYLRRTLELPGAEMTYPVDDPEIVTFNSEVPGLEAAAAGEIDAFLCSEPVGLAAIDDGHPLEELAEPAYHTHKVGYVDRDLTLSPVAFLERINAATRELHASGKLEALSVQFFGRDLATPAGAFDLAAVGQTVP